MDEWGAPVSIAAIKKSNKLGKHRNTQYYYKTIKKTENLNHIQKKNAWEGKPNSLENFQKKKQKNQNTKYRIIYATLDFVFKFRTIYFVFFFFFNCIQFYFLWVKLLFLLIHYHW